MPASIRRSPLRFALVLFAVVSADRGEAMITVGPASDTACQHHDLAAAVQAAANSPGIDLIAISGGPWTAQTTITDQMIESTIKVGGAAVGKSPAMPAHPDLGGKPEELAAIREVVRNFGKN